MIPRQPDDSLYIIRLERNVVRALIIEGVVWIAGILKDDYVPAPDFALRQKRQLGAGAKNKLIYQQVIADRNCVLHRAGWNLDRLDDKSHAEQGHDYGYYC